MCFFAYNVPYANIQMFIILNIGLYAMLEWYEDSTFTKPIEVSNFLLFSKLSSLL